MENKKSQLKIVFVRVMILGIISLMLYSCGGNPGGGQSPSVDFQFMGLENHKVSQFSAYSQTDTLYAATDKGLYALENDGWTIISPESWLVNSVAVLYPSQILVSVTINGDHHLMESLNYGVDWSLVDSNFGEMQGTALSEPPRKLLFDDATGVLFGVGYGVLAQSDDFGRSWTVLDGQWQAFATGLSALTLNSMTGEVWFGGQGGIENPVLKQLDAGEVHDHSSEAAQLLHVPSTVKSIRINEQSGKVLASGEGGIIQSIDNGQQWSALHTNEDSRFYFDVIIEPSDSQVLYTAGWNKNFDDPQPLILEISENAGQTWHQYTYEDPALRGGVWAMTQHEFAGEAWLYLGLCNGGIFKVKVELP